MTDNFDLLAAINTMLLTSGESLINSLGSEGSTDSSIAEFVLEQTTLEYQLRGLTGGIYQFTLAKNADGKFPLPEGTISFEASERVYSTGGDVARLVVRDGYLFDGTAGLFTFDEASLTSIPGRITRLQDWTELPLHSRKAIAAQAAVEYLVQVNADPAKLQLAQQKAFMLTAAHKGHDLSQRSTNILGSGGIPTNASRRHRSSWFPRYPNF